MHSHASCSCGKLKAVVNGDPLRIAICHCEACQKRTGSVFSAQARFNRPDVVVSGPSSVFERKADSGNVLKFHFCPACGATVYYFNTAWPDAIGIPLGAFADPAFPMPRFSVYERTKHKWLSLAGLGMEHSD